MGGYESSTSWGTYLGKPTRYNSTFITALELSVNGLLLIVASIQTSFLLRHNIQT
jgi:hypothetical protein